MKKRLLSLLLVMAMLLSMVPFQAFAEEADIATEIPEAVSVETTVPETTEETVPETTVEIVPETTEETVPETTEETVPETTEETVPETTEETVPETTEETVPETTEETVPETTEELIPEEAAVTPEGSDEPEGPKFNITFPSSARKVEGMPVLTAGQKLNLSTDLSKDDAKKGVEWKIVGGRTYDPRVAPLASLDEVCPDGATANGDEWDAIASIDSKGVLRTNAAVTSENYIVKVEAVSKDEELGYGTLSVLIQPPVESFLVEVDSYDGWKAAPASEEESPDGGVNRKNNWPWPWNINYGSFKIYADYFLPYVMYPEVKWDVKVSKNVADWYETDDNTIVVTPKAPGKLTFTATSRDGSGAKYSGTVVIYGQTRVIDISAPAKMQAGDKPVTLSVKAYYDDAKTIQIAKPNLYWDVVQLRKIDNIDVKDENGNFIYRDENGDILPWVYFDGTGYYGRYNTDTTVKNGKLTLGRITQNTKLLVSAYGEDYAIMWDENGEPIKWGRASDDVVIDVTVLEGSKSLVIAIADWDEDSKKCVPVWAFTETEFMTGAGDYIVPALMDADGNLEPAEGAKLTVKGSAKKDKDDPDHLYFYKDGTATITATLGKQKATAKVTVRMPATFVEINNPATEGRLNSPVTAGKSVKLTATSKHTWQAGYPEGEWQVAKASVQKFEWYLLKQDVNVEDDSWVDYFYDYVTVENDAAKINTKTGVLIAKNVEETTEVQAVVIDSAWNVDVVTVTILPKDKTYITAYGQTIPGTYYVNTMSPYIPLKSIGVTALRGGQKVRFTITDVSVSPAKLAVISDAYLAPEGTVKCIKLTGQTGKATISVTGTIEGQTKPITVNATVNLVNAVTSIDITRPKDKAGNDLPLYVGKSLKLTAKVNSDATNKKLTWHVGYAPYLEMNDSYNKTTIKNGVLKVDKSFYTEALTYYVWATSEDGQCRSQPKPIQAYAMTGAINIASIGDWPNGNYADYLNNRTVTIQQGEEVQFGAMVSDVNGYYEGANQDVTWTISGNKGGIIASEEGKVYITDVLNVTGLKPGTVTIKATAKDGSKKTATFKLVVE